MEDMRTCVHVRACVLVRVRVRVFAYGFVYLLFSACAWVYSFVSIFSKSSKSFSKNTKLVFTCLVFSQTKEKTRSTFFCTYI